MLVNAIRFQSPESAARDPVFDLKSDVFSLGLVLSEIMEGVIPYGELSDAAEVRQAICNNKRPPLSSQCPDPLKKLIDLVTFCCATFLVCNTFHRQCWREVASERHSALAALQMVQAYKPKELPQPNIDHRMPTHP